MKFKKNAIIFATILCTISSVAITASAANEGTITYCDVHLNGYISGVEGPLTITDKIWYNANLTGSEDEIECIVSPTFSHGDENTAYVQPGTNKKTLSKVYLYDQRRMVSGNQVSCGYGGSTAILNMHLGTVDGSISDPLE